MKKCPKCLRIKRFNQFYKHRGHKDGYGSYCKICSDEYSKNYYSQKSKDLEWKEKMLAWVRKAHKKHIALGKRIRYKDKDTQHVIEYRKRHPEKYKAQLAARKKFPIKKPCEVCGSINTDRHHDDYSKPLEIRWLCRTHHNQHHFKINQNKRINQIRERKKQKTTSLGKLFAKFY